MSCILHINTTTGEGASLPVDGDTDEVKTKPPIEGLSLSEPSPPSTGWSAAEREEPSLPKLLELDIPTKVGPATESLEFSSSMTRQAVLWMPSRMTVWGNLIESH